MCATPTPFPPPPPPPPVSRVGVRSSFRLARRKLREVQRQPGSHTMDSQGRKVVVCDNGTGVSVCGQRARRTAPLMLNVAPETGSEAVSGQAS